MVRIGDTLDVFILGIRVVIGGVVSMVEAIASVVNGAVITVVLILDPVIGSFILRLYRMVRIDQSFALEMIHTAGRAGRDVSIFVLVSVLTILNSDVALVPIAGKGYRRPMSAYIHPLY